MTFVPFDYHTARGETALRNLTMSPEQTWPIWDFDYMDAASFVFMDRHEIDTAFTFDRHYPQMNYKVVPQRRR